MEFVCVSNSRADAVDRLLIATRFFKIVVQFYVQNLKKSSVRVIKMANIKSSNLGELPSTRQKLASLDLKYTDCGLKLLNLSSNN